MSQGSHPTRDLASAKRAALCQYAACKGISYEEAESRLEVREFPGGIVLRILPATVNGHRGHGEQGDEIILGPDGKPAGHVPVSEPEEEPES